MIVSSRSMRRVQAAIVLVARLHLHRRVADVEAVLELVRDLAQERVARMARRASPGAR